MTKDVRITHPLKKFRPGPVDPFGKASGRNFLTLEDFFAPYFMELTQGKLKPVTLSVNATRHPRPWRMG